jgi:DNA repair exonuclease SbcCD ATPase subunit
MTQDLTQWITEVRTLQRQLADTRQECDQAHNSAANWRRLYETEARQRRQETAQLHEQIQLLQTQLQAVHDSQGGSVESHQDWRQNLVAADSLSELQSQLNALVARCQELTEQLQAEQQAHGSTRQSLTAALGDAFDTLKPDAPLVARGSAAIKKV